MFNKTAHVLNSSKNINPNLFELAPIQIELVVVEVGADGWEDGTKQLFKARL